MVSPSLSREAFYFAHVKCMPAMASGVLKPAYLGIGPWKMPNPISAWLPQGVQWPVEEVAPSDPRN